MLKMRICFFNEFSALFFHSVRKLAEKFIEERGFHFEHKMRLMLLFLLIK